MWIFSLLFPIFILSSGFIFFGKIFRLMHFDILFYFYHSCIFLDFLFSPFMYFLIFSYHVSFLYFFLLSNFVRFFHSILTVSRCSISISWFFCSSLIHIHIFLQVPLVLILFHLRIFFYFQILFHFRIFLNFHTVFNFLYFVPFSHFAPFFNDYSTFSESYHPIITNLQKIPLKSPKP